MSNKAIFLDRDDTLIEDPGYINNPKQVKLLDGAAEALIEFSDMGYKLVVVSNQSGVARGIVTEKTLGEIHNRLKQLLAEKGAFLDKIYYCPHHPDGVIAKYKKESDWKKPNPGMLLTAAEEMDIDLEQSWAIGNSSRDIEAGLRAGCKTILINRPLHYEPPKPGEPKPDYKAINIKEAVNIVKQYHRSSNRDTSHAESGPTEQTQPVVSKIEPPVLPAVSEHRRDRQVEEQERLTAENAKSAENKLKMDSSFRRKDNIKNSAVSTNSAVKQRPETAPDEQETFGDSPGDSLRRTEQLLKSILNHVKSMQRADMFGEFSMIRFMAGVVQVIVLLCLLLTIWFLMSPNRQDNAVFISLGFAMVLQLMSLTFYVMQRRR